MLLDKHLPSAGTDLLHLAIYDYYISLIKGDLLSYHITEIAWYSCLEAKSLGYKLSVSYEI